MRAKDCGAAILILVIGFIPASHGYAQNPPAAAAAGIFKTKCAMCHAADLSGNTPMGRKLSVPDLRAPEGQNQPDAELIGTITKGMKKMPPFGGKLSKEEIANLVAYLREMARKATAR